MRSSMPIYLSIYAYAHVLPGTSYDVMLRYESFQHLLRMYYSVRGRASTWMYRYVGFLCDQATTPAVPLVRLENNSHLRVMTSRIARPRAVSAAPRLALEDEPRPRRINKKGLRVYLVV